MQTIDGCQSTNRISSKTLRAFRTCQILQDRLARDRLYIAVLGLLSILDAPSLVLDYRVAVVANYYTLALTVLAIPIVCHANWCKTRLFAEQHSIGILKVSLKGVGWFNRMRYSLYRNELFAEIALWLVFAPPYIRDTWPLTRILDVGCFLRVYALFMYWGSQHFSSRFTNQALARLFKRHINLHFVIAATLHEHPGKFLSVVVVTFWTVTSLMFSRFEGRDLYDSFYFVWVTCGTIGYGDVYPHTAAGQCISILCGAFAWIMMSFAVSPLRERQMKPKVNLELIVIGMLSLIRRREAAAFVVLWTIRYAGAKRRCSVAGGGVAGVTGGAGKLWSASHLHAACKVFAHHKTQAAYYRVKYDTMVNQYASIKYLDVFAAKDRLAISGVKKPTDENIKSNNDKKLPSSQPHYTVTLKRLEKKTLHLASLLLSSCAHRPSLPRLPSPALPPRRFTLSCPNDIEMAQRSVLFARTLGKKVGMTGLNTLKNVASNGTLHAVLLQSSLDRLLRRAVSDAIPSATPTVTSEKTFHVVRRLEQQHTRLRWLRGTLCCLAVATMVLSLLVLRTDDLSFNKVIVMLSVVAQLVLLQTYSVKSTISALVNPIYRGKGGLYFSPYLNQMIGEMLFWCIQCPPTLESTYPVNMLGFVVFGRVYSLVLYMNLRTTKSTFRRCMSAMMGVPLSNSFFVRTSLIKRKVLATFCVVSFCWFLLALLFSKADDMPYDDGVWFIFVTVGTIGYGDICPVSPFARIAALLAWVFALVGIGYSVVLVQGSMMLKAHEQVLFLLFRSNKLFASNRVHAVTMMQRAWRYHMAKRKGLHIMKQNMLAFGVAQQAEAFYKCRKAMRDATKSIHPEQPETLSPLPLPPQTPDHNLPTPRSDAIVVPAGGVDASLALLEERVKRLGLLLPRLSQP